VCAFGLGLIVMMAMMMVMVPEALRQGGGYVNANVNVKISTDLEPSIGQNFHKFRVSIGPKLP